MNQITVKINGMACGMCEAHINDVIRKTFPDAQKVSASYTKGEAVFLAEAPVDEEVLRKAIDETGYTFVSCDSKPYEKKKGFFGLFGK